MVNPSYKFVTVYDWYNTDHTTRVRCEDVDGMLCISYRQYRDAMRRVRLLSGSVLRADSDSDIYVFRADGSPCGLITRR